MRVNRKKLRNQLNKETVSMTREDITKLKYNSTVSAVDQIRVIPAYVLRDEFGFGQKRIQQFLNKFNEVMTDMEDKYIDLDDIRDVLKDEVNIHIGEETAYVDEKV